MLLPGLKPKKVTSKIEGKKTEDGRGKRPKTEQREMEEGPTAAAGRNSDHRRWRKLRPPPLPESKRGEGGGRTIERGRE